jgi:hypothetical protein
LTAPPIALFYMSSMALSRLALLFSLVPASLFAQAIAPDQKALEDKGRPVANSEALLLIKPRSA